MAELATIARPYAEALFAVASPDLDTALKWLETFRVITQNRFLLQFAGHPGTTAAQVFDLVTSVCPAPLPVLASNFLRTVIDNRRIGIVPAIADQFRALKNAQSGSTDAVVYSAFDMDADTLAGLSVTLERRFARKLNLSVQRQPDLIGGIRVVVGDMVLDTSVRARLDQMKTALTAHRRQTTRAHLGLVADV